MVQKLQSIPKKILEWWNKFDTKQKTIIVSVVLETMKQIDSQMLVRNYKGFLNS